MTKSKMKFLCPCFVPTEDVSKCTMTQERNLCKDTYAMPLHLILRGMSKGTIMHKVRTPDRWYRRKFSVDVQNLRLSYKPSRRRFCSVKRTNYDLYEIDEVRTGWNTDVFNKMESKFRRKLQSSFHPHLRSILKEENCLSVVFAGPAPAVVDLICPCKNVRDAWMRGLNHLLAICKSSQKELEYDRWLKEQVRNADVNNNGSLNFEECLTLLNQLNVSMDRKDAKRLFDESNFRKVKIDGEDALDPEEFVHFYRALLQRPEIEELMKSYSVSKSTILDVEELQNFLRKEQKMHLTLAECRHVINKFEPEEGTLLGYMSLKGFEEMLLSVDHDIFNKKHRIIYQDMNHPLSHYYIASSHNTYLLEGQIIGESSIEGYISALKRGCRCLELDTWDGPDCEPIIFHGYTFTTRIFFRDVLEAIKQYAFRASQYPVILSIENHCSIPQQKKMAYHLVTILGDYLYRDSISAEETSLPSPEKLARKIIIKAKKLGFLDEKEIRRGQEWLDQEQQLLEQEQQELEQDHLQYSFRYNETNHKGNSPDSPPPVQEIPQAAPSRRVAKDLSDLVNYCEPVHFSSFEESEQNWKFHNMSSFSETDALDLTLSEGKKFMNHNSLFLSRIYPKGMRTDSSNYNPVPLWNVGCQIVALNYQTMDEPMFLNEAKFAQNGKCGYILKPKFLYDKRENYDPNCIPDPKYKKILRIRVISGQQLPKPGQSLEGEVVDPYVCIKVYGHPLDEKKLKTRYIDNNGFNPFWNETLVFRLHQPELAMLRIVVKDHNTAGKNETLGQFFLPFTSITEGYRHIHLEDTQGQPLVLATLFVHVSVINDTMP